MATPRHGIRKPKSAACRTCAHAWKRCRVLGSKEATELFEHYGVFSPRELHSRMEITIEQYCLSVGLEARTAIEMAKTIIFPAAIRYQGELAATCANLKAVGYTFDTDTLDKITGLVKDLQDGTAKLEKALADAWAQDQARTRGASMPCGNPGDGRGAQDRGHFEGMVADDLWPLATYQEMLFIM